MTYSEYCEKTLSNGKTPISEQEFNSRKGELHDKASELNAQASRSQRKLKASGSSGSTFGKILSSLFKAIENYTGKIEKMSR